LDTADGEYQHVAGTISGTSPADPGGQGRRRARQPVPRTRTVECTLTAQEYALLVEAARQAGMARRAYVATVVLDGAANGTTISGQDPLELILIELMHAAGLVRRITANLNQAAAKLTATGQHAGELPGWAAESTRRAGHIDAVADTVRKALQRQSQQPRQ
jgi:hypothetical protein